MPFCAHCGTEIAAEQPLCANCGQPRGVAATGTKRTEGRATAALVTGIVGLTICPIVGSVVAIILGLQAKRKISQDPTLEGDGLATGGIVLGAAGFVVPFIFAAIAVPTFLGARQRAQDRAAHSSLRNGLTAAKTLWVDVQSYTAVDPATLQQFEPSLAFVPGTVSSSGPDTVSLLVVDPTEIRMAALSAGGTCWAIRDDIDGGGVTYAERESSACSADLFTPVEFSPSWSIGQSGG